MSSFALYCIFFLILSSARSMCDHLKPYNIFTSLLSFLEYIGYVYNEIDAYSHLFFTVIMIWFVWCIKYSALTNTALALKKKDNILNVWSIHFYSSHILYVTYCPSLKYSFNVVLNFFEYFTNSFFRCSTACFPDVPGIKPTTSLTASSNFLMALAISLCILIRINYQIHWQFVFKTEIFQLREKSFLLDCL